MFSENGHKSVHGVIYVRRLHITVKKRCDVMKIDMIRSCTADKGGEFPLATFSDDPSAAFFVIRYPEYAETRLIYLPLEGVSLLNIFPAGERIPHPRKKRLDPTRLYHLRHRRSSDLYDSFLAIFYDRSAL